MQRFKFNLLLTGITALYFAFALYLISDIPLLDPDEPRYAAAGRTMSDGGSLIIPEFNGKPRINKPPLFYWFVALSDQFFGEASELSARMPSIVMGLIMLLSTVYLGCRVYGDGIGLMAGLILCTTPLFIALSRCCITDMTLSAFMGLTLAVLMLATLGLTSPWKSTVFAACFFGMAILTKATPAFSVVLVVFIDRAMSLAPDRRPRMARNIPWFLAIAMAFSFAAFLLRDSYATLDMIFVVISMAIICYVILLIINMAVRAPCGVFARMPWIWGLCFAVGIGVAWYIALIAKIGFADFYSLLNTEIAGRLAGQMHREPMHYYIPLLFGVTFPWAIGLVGSTYAAWPEQRSISDETNAQRGDRFCLAWLAGIIFFFSIPGAKLASYILPAAPAISLLMARFFSRLSCEESVRIKRLKQLTIGIAFLFASGIAAFGFVCTYFPTYIPKNLQDVITKIPLPLLPVTLGLALAVLCCWLLACTSHIKKSVMALSLLIGVIIFVGLPAALDNLKNRSTKDLCMKVMNQIKDCQRIVSVGAEVESLSYYLARPVLESRRRRVARRQRDETSPMNVGEAVENQDEDFISVINEELMRPEAVVLFIQNRYFGKILGLKASQVAKMDDAEIVRSAPDHSRLLGRDHHIIVFRNDR